MIAATPPPMHDAARFKAGSGTIGLSSLARAVKRYSLLVFVFVLLGAAAGALIYFFLPLPKMTGRIVYLVNTSPGGQLNPNYWNDRDPANYRALQANTLVRTDTLQLAVREAKVASQPLFQKDRGLSPIQYLQSHLKVDWSGGSEHMRVTLEGDTQDELEIILKAVDMAYLKTVRELEFFKRQERLENLQKLQNEQNESIKTVRRQIRNIISNGDTSLAALEEVRARHLQSRMNSIENEMQRLNERERALGFAFKKLSSEVNVLPQFRPPVDPALVESYVDNDRNVVELTRALDRYDFDLQPFKKSLVEGAAKPPLMVEVEQKFVDTQIKLKNLKDQLRIAIAKQLKDDLAKKESQILESVKGQMDLTAEHKELAMKEVKDVVKQLGDLREASSAADDLRIALANSETIVSRINTELVTIKTEMNSPGRVSFWEKPYVVSGIEGNRRVKYTALTALAFIVLGLSLAQWLELRHRRIQSIDEISSGLGLQVLGTVPAIPKGGAGARSNWPHLLTEAVNTTRTMLLSGPNAATTKTMLITSAMSGEGKTSLTTHLAVSLAGAGRRVLLIDADMRRPAVHKVLGVESKPGLAELLIGTARLEDVTVATKVAGLHLVPAGAYSREAAASLSTERWANILRDASVGFDFVLVDSPPILPVADALAIAKNVDGVLISVMQDLSRYGAVQTACQRLSMVGAKVLGVVVSGVKSSGGYYYYYYDERYSKSGVETEAAPAAAPIVTVLPPPTS